MQEMPCSLWLPGARAGKGEDQKKPKKHLGKQGRRFGEIDYKAQ